MESDLYDEIVPVPRAARFPIELRPPPGFRPDDPATWPRVDGRLEYVAGRLLYMAPCGDVQQDVTPALLAVLMAWAPKHLEFVVAGNEAGMILRGDVRGADAAVWRRDALGPYTGGFRRVPPVLAVEVAGQDDDERALRDKAAWYLKRGVRVVWLVLPGTRAVVVLRAAGVRRFRSGQRIAADRALPGLTPPVSKLFRQLK